MKSSYSIGRPIVRATALAAVAFMLLASGRAIVPKVCATQQALASCHEPAPQTDCCESPTLPTALSTGDIPEQLTTDGVHCAFCVLATGVVLAPEYGGQVGPGEPFNLPSYSVLDEPALPTLWVPARPRDPPAVA